MKFLHLVPVLAVSAALGATSASPGRDRTPAPAGALATPFWLAEQEPGEEGQYEADGADDPHSAAYATSPDTASGACTYDPGDDAPGCESCAAGDDPHAGTHAAADGDPHAGMYGDGDPHAGMYGDGDPHAGIHAAADGDPHAGMYGDGDPHAGMAAGEPPPHALAEPATPTSPVERSRASNGKTVAEVFAARSRLDQTRVAVRGTVVKLTEGVLGKNYLHLRDGTGTAEAGDDDLMVTTTEAFSIGETVEVEGQLAIDQDVGVGYSYPALLTDATRVQH
jgi:hypothetical protein